jgi:hypothetical protein
LGLQAPWAVERVELRVEPGGVEVWVAAEAGTPHARGAGEVGDRAVS